MAMNNDLAAWYAKFSIDYDENVRLNIYFERKKMKIEKLAIISNFLE